ncbi:MAG: 3-deoxy-manno-octulosonate cytidylyltransferase [Planctomycetota bacterium]|nr:3-deoxy-manno-octulosonate cytidylyltransferase [Planctomycetota bacterium]
MNSIRSMIVIPARMHSTRLPGKMLLQTTGKPLIQHTYEAAVQAVKPERVIVATDHEEIYNTVVAFGGEAMMTDPEAASGTDRVAEVAENYPGMDIFVNVQGDEPEICPESIDLAIESLETDEKAVMSTLATPIRKIENLLDHSCVKVIFDDLQNTLYFSRGPIPMVAGRIEDLIEREPPIYYQHIGLYCYRRAFLKKIQSIPVSSLERIERLEQLRVLQSGYRIKTAIITESYPGIDTPEDYDAFVKRWLT